MVTNRFEKADSRVNFREATDIATQCGNCCFFSTYGSCQLVEGNISATDTCDLHKAGTPASYADVIDLCAAKDENTPGESRLFVEADVSSLPQWINILPKPGTYSHPQYGKVKITKKRNHRFADNLNSGAYQKQVPVGLEHKTQLSGAAAWIKKAKVNADGSVDGQLEYTDLGSEAVKSKRFKYFSPEMFDKWTNPVSGQEYEDVLVGGAFCVRPFFKEESLKPIIATESGLKFGEVLREDDQVTIIFSELNQELNTMADETKPTSTSEKQGSESAKDAPKTVPTVPEPAATAAQYTDQLAALAAENTKLREFTEVASAQLKEMSEKLEKREKADRIKRFTDEVRGRSDDNSVQWHGEIEAHVKRLAAFADAFGEDSEEFKSYVTDQRAVAEKLRASAVYAEVGSDGRALKADNPVQRMNDAIRAKQGENPGMNFSDAIAAVEHENPTVYAEYVKFTRTRV